MAQFLDAMIHSIMTSVPGSQEQQQKQTTALSNQNTNLVNQSVAFKLGQEKLQAEANNQLIPLQLQASQSKLKEEIGKAQLSIFMQPYQKEQLKATMLSSAATGSNPNTGMTGEPDLDAQIAIINQRANQAAILKPEDAGTQLAHAARATSELRKAGKERREQKTDTFIQHVAVTPIDSLLSEAKLKPDDDLYKFIVAAKSNNPNITNQQLQSQISRVFGMDAKDREVRDFEDKRLTVEQDKFRKTYDETLREHDLRHSETVAKMAETAEATKARLAQTRENRLSREAIYSDKRDDKRDKYSNDTVSKALGEYDKYNTDDKARGAGSTFRAIRAIESIAGQDEKTGQPLSPTSSNIFNKLSRGSAPDGTVDAKQIVGLTTAGSQLGSFYANSGQRSVKDILGSTRAAGLLPDVGNALDAILFGGGNTKLKDKDSRMQFASVLSELHGQMVNKIAGDQIEKSNIALTDPNISPSHKIRLAANIMDSPNTLQPTKYNTAIKLFQDLSQRGIEAQPQDAEVITKILNKLSKPSSPKEIKIVSDTVLKIYNKYIRASQQDEASLQRREMAAEEPQVNNGVVQPIQPFGSNGVLVPAIPRRR